MCVHCRRLLEGTGIFAVVLLALAWRRRERGYVRKPVARRALLLTCRDTSFANQSFANQLPQLCTTLTAAHACILDTSRSSRPPCHSLSRLTTHRAHEIDTRRRRVLPCARIKECGGGYLGFNASAGLGCRAARPRSAVRTATSAFIHSCIALSLSAHMICTWSFSTTPNALSFFVQC